MLTALWHRKLYVAILCLRYPTWWYYGSVDPDVGGTYHHKDTLSIAFHVNRHNPVPLPSCNCHNLVPNTQVGNSSSLADH